MNDKEINMRIHDGTLRRINSLETSQKNKELITEWDRELFAKGCKPTTQVQYLQGPYRLLKWKPKLELQNITRNETITFKEQLTKSKHGSKQKPYSERTIGGYLFALKEFLKWQSKGALMDWFKPKRITEGRLDPEQILTQADVLDLVQAAKGKRNKAILYCLWESGCRRSEFLNLKIGNLQIEEKIASFQVNGKTGKRPCYLIASLPTLIDYLEDDHGQKHNKEAWLWQK